MWPIAATVAVVAMLVVHVVDPGPVGKAAYIALIVGAGVAALVGVRRHPAGQRLAWLWVALAVSSSALGEVIWAFNFWVRDREPDVSLADIVWIGSYIAIFAGLWRMLRQRRADRRVGADSLIDMAAIAAVAAVLAWQYVIADTITDTSVPLTTRLVWAAYPALDAMLLVLVLRMSIGSGKRAFAGRILALGVACWLFADISYALLETSETIGRVLDLGWMIGYALLAAAIWHHTARDRPSYPPEENVSRNRILLSLLPLLIPAAIEIEGNVRGKDANPWPLLLLTATLVGLVYLRSIRLLAAEARARARLRSREHHFRALATNSSDAVIVVSPDGSMLEEGIGIAALMGIAREPKIGTNAFASVSTLDLDEVQSTFSKVLASPGIMFEGEHRALRPDGSEVWLGSRAVNMTADADVGGIVVSLHDITGRKQVEEQLSHQAFHDVLTGLANRALFRDRIEHALSRASRTEFHPAVVFMDLDGFKTVNDRLGHDGGDEVLREVARRLAMTIRTGDTIARLGGDEFAILIDESHRPQEEAEGVAERILSTFLEPISVDDEQVKLSASLGVAVGDDTATATMLLRNADVAMYRAKAAGKNRWVVYDAAMRVAAVERLQFEIDLVGALEAGEFRLVYQPVIELASAGDGVVGFEALLRWDHPTLGTLSPDRFIPIIEDTGLIVATGAWVLREACLTAARWQTEYAREGGLSMAVNISARQLASPDLVKQVERALEESGLEPSLLVLEITESVLITDASVAARRLQALRALGIRLAIDDFGTGYSSLSYLREFPVDILKIDKSFIDGITDANQIPAIVRGLLDLARTLDLEVVAEGVEHLVQRDQLRAEQCDFAQGYLFAEPLDADEAELMLMRVSAIWAAAHSATTTRAVDEP